MDALATISPADEAPAVTPRVLLDQVDARFVDIVPIAFARRFRVLGLAATNGCQPVAVCAATPLAALDKLTVLLGKPTQAIHVPENDLEAAISAAYGRKETPVDAVIAHCGDVSALLADGALIGQDLLDSDSAAPVTRLVNVLLLEAVKRRASDVHIQPLDQRLQVRLRIDGVLYDFVQPPVGLQDEMVSRIKVMGRMNIAEKRLPQDGRTTVSVGDKIIDLRISTLPTSHGERVVLRLLDKSARLYRLAELGMAEKDLESFRRLIRQPHGIVLVTGPTGSGKSTTLYAALQELNSKELNVLTLEDPIEYELPGISQTQVSDKKGLTFATGLRTVLRQDPDVIMVGEIRDGETARMAIQSALTGHLVFSTLHTNDAAGAVARLLDLGVEPYLVAGSLLGVLAQRLVRQVCAQCRVAGELTSVDQAALGLHAARKGPPLPPVQTPRVYAAGGCPRCQQTGYYDRVGIFEMLTMDDLLRDLIAASARSLAIKRQARAAGMSTLRDDALRKLWLGVTTVDEVLRVTHADTAEAAA